MEKHFVTFYSPGTFVAENTTKEIDSWDVHLAIDMSKSITERYGAKPYAFQFTTRSRSEEELDSKVAGRSGTYYLGGRVMTLEEVKEELPHERILIENMECNGWGKIIYGRSCQPFNEEDTLIEV